ncbi:disintegrin and metalloproteinase domain-containing protein 25-like [Dipodomys spectabilis]|uniref:disintegrin and metalloproteinase domain-containing protein 25-like n=1 Tax=Dipodomys spectabilis TaxID=105255 RepID=UPI001C534333|nr:disintegrin and metalloproteinase domain-containing protein 25-like [Dipodomys spectabilis]
MAEGEGLVYMRSTVLQLWLAGLFCLSGWPRIGQAQHHSPPEVLIPMKINDNGGGIRSKEWISYSLPFGNKRHIVHLKAKRNLVSPHFSLFTYTEQGVLLEDQPFVQNDCYYQGYVEGDPESLVVLSTCLGGLRGTLQINNILYEIKPKNLSATFEHLVYKMDSEETHFPPMRCAITEEEIAQQLKFQETDDFIPRQSGYEGWWTHRWFLELAFVVDNKRFLDRKSNVSRVIQEVFVIVSEADSIFFALDIEASLVGLEIWTEKNHVQGTNLDKLLLDFCIWKRYNFNPRVRSDIGHLLMQQNFGRDLGKASLQTVCNSIFNCGVNRILGENLYHIGHIVAHEIGHNLGMFHDRAHCSCGVKVCIMAPADNYSRKFSNCSYAKFMETIGRTDCMRLPPHPLHIYKHEFCGNREIDVGEECDCGSIKLCNQDPCCLANCTLQSEAECASGLCCEDCHLQPSGTVCREKKNVCDLPEWCNGISQHCPEDVYLSDGSPCPGSGYCYENRCNNRDEQCQKIFGSKARNANQLCYREMNTRGDRFGNCGFTSNEYRKCDISDIYCGRIQCENVAEVPMLASHSTVHWTHFNEVTCWGTDYHWGIEMPDIGDIKDGSECGIKHLCLHRKCVPMPVWAHDCSPRTCNMRGVCNNKQHCHCNKGWKPPNCWNEGFGGSVDSGPPPWKDQPTIEFYYSFCECGVPISQVWAYDQVSSQLDKSHLIKFALLKD